MVPCCEIVMWEFFGGKWYYHRLQVSSAGCDLFKKPYTPGILCPTPRAPFLHVTIVFFLRESWIPLKTTLHMFLMRHLKCIANMWDVPQSTAGATELNIRDYHWITVQWLPTPHNASMGKAFTPGSLYLRNMRGVSL